MGGSLTVLKNEKKKLDQTPLFGLPISEVREHWTQFKMICNGFWIDYEQFHKVFKESDKIFNLWDFQENGLIDVLELFSCLLLFSKSEFDEKIKFIFEIYDFNDLHSLTTIDVEYIINCCLCSMLRVYKCPPEHEPEQDRISHLVNEQFKAGDLIHFTLFLNFIKKNETILDFINAIDQSLPIPSSFLKNDQMSKCGDLNQDIPEYLITPDQPNKTLINAFNSDQLLSDRILHSQTNVNKNIFISNFIEKIQNFGIISETINSNLRLNWVYGFRYSDVVHSLIFLESKNSDNKIGDRLIYFSNRVVIVYYHILNKQMIYNEHINKVSVITISEDNRLCASGDGGKKPKIRIWSIIDLKTKIVLSGISNSEIYLLKFIKKDKYLVSVLKRSNQPLLIYDLMKGTIKATFSMQFFLLDLVSMFHLWPQIDTSETTLIQEFKRYSIDGSFFAYTKTNIHMFLYETKASKFKHQIFDLKDKNNNIEITGICALFSCKSDPEIAVYSPKEEMDVVILVSLLSGKVISLSNLLSENMCIKKEIKSFQTQVLQMIFLKEKFVCLFTSDSILHILDFTSKTITFSFPLTSLEIKLNSYEIKNMERISGKRIALVTKLGEIILIEMKQILEWDSRILKPKIKTELINGVISLPLNSRCICLLEMESNEKNLLMAGGDNYIYTISSSQHKLINKWLSPEPVTSMDCVFNKAIGIVNAIGTKLGLVMIRVHWNKVIETFNCKSEIIILKFSKTGRILIATTRNFCVFVFVRKNGLYFKTKEDSFKIPSEIVVSLNFNENSNNDGEGFVIMTTHIRNHYSFSLILKNPYQPLFINTLCFNRQTNFRYTTDIYEDLRPIVLCSSPFVLVCGESVGTITMYDSDDNFKNKITGFYNGHCNSIDEILVGLNLDMLYSLSKIPGELFEWKIKLTSLKDKIEYEGGVTKYFYQAHDAIKNQIKTVSSVNFCSNQIVKKLGIDKKIQDPKNVIKSKFKIKKNQNSQEINNNQKSPESHTNKINNELLNEQLISNESNSNKSDIYKTNQHDEPGIQDNILKNEVENEQNLKNETNQPDLETKNIKDKDSYLNIVHNQIQKTNNVRFNGAFESDSFAYFRSFVNSDLRSLFKDRVHITIDPKDVSKRSFPEYSLKLKYIYGISSYEFRNTCYYLHASTSIKSAINDNTIRPNNQNEKFKNANASRFHDRVALPNDSILPSKLAVSISMMGINTEEETNENKFLQSKKEKMIQSIKNSILDKNDSRKRKRKPNEEINKARFGQNYGAYLVEKELSKFLRIVNSNVISSNSTTESSFSQIVQNYGRCQGIHEDCCRQILYVVSRIAVITDPHKVQSQRFYQGHSSQISAIVLHPIHNIAASGEIDINPHIHIWNTTFCFNVSVIETKHEKGIMLLDFFPFETYVVSTSVDRSNSIQISDWKNGCSVAFRNTSLNNIISVKTHPFQPSHFVSGSLEQVDYWEVKSQNIIHLKSVFLKKYSFHGYVSTLTFLIYNVNKEDKADLLITSSHGHIGAINDYEYVTPSLQIDQSIVNVVRLLKMEGTLFIFIGCEDGWVRGYTIGFEKIFEWKETERSANSKVKTRGVQSLDFYLCNSNFVYVILLTRDGKLIELELVCLKEGKNKYRFVFKANEKNKEVQKTGKLEKLLLHAHAAQTYEEDSKIDNINQRKKVLISLNQEREIMASVGDDENLFIWDIKTFAPIKVLPLQMRPTAIKFAPNNRLLIGFFNGKVKIFDLEFMTSFELGNTHSIVIKEHPFIIFDSEIQTAVLNMEISDKGERLAVSYDILRVEHEVENRKKETGGFIVSVYQIRTKQITVASNEGCPYKQFDELRPSILNQFEMSKILCQNMAVHHMSFSEDYVHLVVYLQKMNQNQMRNVNDQDGQYIIRNITTHQVHNVTDNNHVISLKRVNFPSHIHGIKLSADLKTDSKSRQKMGDIIDAQEFTNNKITLSAICDSDKVCVLGSTKGEIFLGKSFLFSVGNSQPAIEFPLNEMIQAKTYPAHTSFVNQIEMDSAQKHLLSTGISDECIYQWEIEKVEEVPDMDMLTSINNQMKFCHDIPNKNHYLDLVRILYPSRAQIIKILTDKDQKTVSKLSLNLYKVIGRKSMIRRHNVVVSSKNQLVYCSGTLLVILESEVIEQRTSKQNQDNEFGIHNMKKQQKETNNGVVSEIVQRKINSLGPVKQLNSNEVIRNVNMETSVNKALISEKKLTGFVADTHKNNNLNKSIQAKLKKKRESKGKIKSKQINNHKKNQQINSHHNDMTVSDNNSASNLRKKASLISCDDHQDIMTITRFTLKNQQFLFPINNKNIAPASDIACIELTNDGNILAIATNDSIATLYFYHLPSVSFLSSLFLESCKCPVFIRFSVDSKFMFCCGLDMNYTLTVFYIDVCKTRLLGVLNLMYSVPYAFKDGMFIPTKNDGFILIGPSQVTSWKYSANILTFKQLGTKPSRSSVNENKTEFYKKDEKYDSVFISMRFIFPNMFICGSSSGYLFLWENEICQLKISCFKKLPITTIVNSSINKGEFLVGGFGPNLKYYQVNSTMDKGLRVECLCEVNIFGSESFYSWNEPRFQVQTLLFDKSENLIIGFRDGSMSSFEVNFDEMKIEQDVDSNFVDTVKTDMYDDVRKINAFKLNSIMSLFDDQMIVNADFSFDSKLIYCLTDGSCILVYASDSLTQITVINLRSEGFDIIALELQVFVQLKHEVIVFEPTSHIQLPQFDYQNKHVISIMRVDPNQKYLCLALKSEQEKLDYVELFRIEVNGLVKVFQSKTQNDKVSIVDFSIDSATFMFQTFNGVINIYQIGLDRIEDMGNDFDYHNEWSGDGLRVSKKVDGVFQHFSEDNSLVDLLRIKDKGLIAVDEMGTVSLLDSII